MMVVQEDGTVPVAERRTVRRRSAVPITETELRLIAAAAIMGLRSSPKTGYSVPAATGTPRALSRRRTGSAGFGDRGFAQTPRPHDAR